MKRFIYILLAAMALLAGLCACRQKIEEPMNMNQYDIDHWIDAIQNDGEPAVLPEQAATVVRVIEGIYESARTGQVVYFE